MNEPYAVDRVRWSRLNIFEQMGNIYSEVGRAFNAKKRHDEPRYTQAITRAIDLFDATTDHLVTLHSPKAREVLRAKEEFLAACDSMRPADVESLDRYFMQFALAARLRR